MLTPNDWDHFKHALEQFFGADTEAFVKSFLFDPRLGDMLRKPWEELQEAHTSDSYENAIDMALSRLPQPKPDTLPPHPEDTSADPSLFPPGQDGEVPLVRVRNFDNSSNEG